jgi:hypothetical protein
MFYLDVERIDDVVDNQLKVWMSKPVFDVSLPSGKVVVGDDDLVALEHQLVYQMRSDESGASADQNPTSILVIQKCNLRIVALVGWSANKEKFSSKSGSYI